MPGVPGEDYPIYAEVPETAFSCEGQVEGGYYSGRVTDARLKKNSSICHFKSIHNRVSAIFVDLSPYHIGRPITPLIDIPKYFRSNMPLEVA